MLHSLKKAQTASLQTSNMKLIHNLFTFHFAKHWTTCGRSVDHAQIA